MLKNSFQASEMTIQSVLLARTLNLETFLPVSYKSSWSRGRSFTSGARGPGFKSWRKYGYWSPSEIFGSLVFRGPKWVLFDPLKSVQNFIQLQLLYVVKKEGREGHL